MGPFLIAVCGWCLRGVGQRRELRERDAFEFGLAFVFAPLLPVFGPLLGFFCPET